MSGPEKIPERRFPVLAHYPYREHQWLGAESVPWTLLAPHEAQALRNHDQTLERLADRGGLSPSEMVAVLEDRAWRSMPDAEALARLRELLAAHEGASRG